MDSFLKIPTGHGLDAPSKKLQVLLSHSALRDIDELTLHEFDWWLDSEARNRRLEMLHPAMHGSAARTDQLELCKGLGESGSELLTLLAQLPFVPQTSVGVAELLYPENSPEEAHARWEIVLARLQADLTMALPAIEKYQVRLQAEGRTGGRPEKRDRDRVFLDLCQHLHRVLKARKPKRNGKLVQASVKDATQEEFASIAADLFNAYFADDSGLQHQRRTDAPLSEDSALKILRKHPAMTSDAAQRKKPRIDRAG